MDAYAYYVLALGLSEDLFWNADIAFLASILTDKNAYDRWQGAVSNLIMEEAKRR